MERARSTEGSLWRVRGVFTQSQSPSMVHGGLLMHEKNLTRVPGEPEQARTSK